MNPLLLLLLGLGGLMSAMGTSGGSGDDDTGTADLPATAPPQPDTGADDDAPAPATPPGNAAEEGAGVSLTMVVWDLSSYSVVREINDGDEIDFGTAPVSNYTFAAQVDGASGIGSMLLTYGDQVWLQNYFPYSLDEAPYPIDLSAGEFEVSVTVFSGRNAAGEVLATETVSFSTSSVGETSSEVVVEDDPIVEDDKPVEDDMPPPVEDDEPVGDDTPPPPPAEEE